MNRKIKPFLDILIIAILFVVTSYVIQSNIDYFKGAIGKSVFSMFLYVLLAIASEVIVPIASVPIMPLASHVWGWPFAAVLSIIGWTIGAFIAFMIARIYGVQVVKRFVSFEKIQKYERRIPRENIFWSIVFIRMVLPVDVVSYVLGLFSKIDVKTFTLATAIGITPFAFVLAYLGKISIYYLVLLVIGYFIVLAIWFLLKSLRKRRKIK